MLTKEPGGKIVKSLLEATSGDGCEILISNFNVLEVCLYFLRKSKVAEADSILDEVKSYNINIIDTLSDEVLLNAAKIKIKIKHKMSLADSILIGQGQASKAEIVTSDYHELKKVDKAEEITFYWFRDPPPVAGP